ncbi:glutamine synthetase [Thraustotheca clavata]|uniref:Glutamine synthetase n=1 Tax=Thraustotheca clavata TaxID=74557 RepID=A0A1V9ZPV8_9STRA|nr:glutamine synthetase [Thraustotheca clavata]
MSKLDRAVYDKYMELETGSFIQAEYIWVGGSGEDLRCKTRTLDKMPKSPADLPIWNFDGSSTGQAPGEDSEVMLKPAAIYKDPFRRGNHILVMCDCYKPDMTPIPSNTRFDCARVMKACEKEIPWFGIEQEYTLFEADKVTPYGWPKGGYPGAQGPYYCGAGAHSAFGRLIADAHYRACLYAGIRVSGINAEVMPGQWEYQVGPCTGIDAGDQLWISRYILLRVCEDFGVIVSFDPKPIPGDWNGAGCHTNVSTKAMREDGGMKKIIEALEKLKLKHKVHIAAYGTGNERRLTGRHETASIDQFSYGVANRGASIRIPRVAEAEGKGYFEDRRPSSNMDPYVVTGRIMKTISLNEA